VRVHLTGSQGRSGPCGVEQDFLLCWECDLNSLPPSRHALRTLVTRRGLQPGARRDKGVREDILQGMQNRKQMLIHLIISAIFTGDPDVRELDLGAPSLSLSLSLSLTRIYN
jgi:hypothetical protein